MRLSPPTLRRLLTGKTRARVYEALATHMENGLSVRRTLQLLRHHVPAGVWVQESLLDGAAERIDAGGTLATALEGCIPDMEYMLLRAGDAAGRQIETLHRVADLVHMQDNMAQRVGRALGYPLFLLLLFVGLLMTVALFVVPAFLNLVALPRWQGFALMLYELSAFVASWKGVMLALALGGLLCLMVFSLSRWTGKGRAWADSIPPWSLYRLMVSSMWLFTLATMLRGGIRMAQALEITRQCAHSPWLAQHIDAITACFSRGMHIGQALTQGHDTFLEKEMAHEFAVYAPLPGFAEKLPHLAEQWLNGRVEQVARACTRLNVLAIFGILGLLVMVGLAVMDLVSLLSEGMNFP